MNAESPVRPLRAADAEQVAELERLCNPLPWKAADLEEFDPDHPGNSGGRKVGLVLESEGGEIAGYLCATQGFGEAEILVFGVDPALRRRGLGRALLAKLDEALAARGCGTVFLEVRRSNAAAIALYRTAGFREIGARAQYYADNGEDAVLMRRG